MNLVNSTLPIPMKVLAKTGYAHYTLLLNKKQIQTKSMIELEVGAEYLAELYMEGGVINFKHLCKRPNFTPYAEGLELILKFLEEEFDFKRFIVQNLSSAKDAQSFRVFKEMLFASFENVYHIPFIFEDKACLFQLRKRGSVLEIYLYFSVFGALKIVKDDVGISIFTPFLKVQKFLNEHLEYRVFQDKNLKAFFEYKKLLDFKG
ncbi:hypothetical protein [Campylobacter helveticus]|uniref:Uncharacterized protein n=1 Tax=Campylobacter helveticus TaxID=28898 RepID=A0AAX2UIC9_9BACT|nr:hypothetical protein [Campylobacter helveticus]ARE80472.1 hypothetical protein CHELV3228_0879 [Campylobacter helveticus]MCR2039790.1 hypothetical protein [Campylobacter helveticus]MCR2055016.1 hypothetical protein [Campylobacter helveticus]MCR2056322.1 hypothetical protein [Campylobacter helveticus]MCR2060170.1 hypothetical protein [Campylobacter helveticus]